jgi:hypothetical protein
MVRLIGQDVSINVLSLFQISASVMMDSSFQFEVNINLMFS